MERLYSILWHDERKFEFARFRSKHAQLRGSPIEECNPMTSALAQERLRTTVKKYNAAVAITSVHA